MSGLDAPVSPCLQFRLRRFPPSLPSPSVSSSLPAPTCSASTSGSDCPPPARPLCPDHSMLVLLLEGQCKFPENVVPHISHIKPGTCRGLRPCPLCYFCQSDTPACAGASARQKQHRSKRLRTLLPWCEVLRHHPPGGRGLRRINIYKSWVRASARPVRLQNMLRLLTEITLYKETESTNSECFLNTSEIRSSYKVHVRGLYVLSIENQLIISNILLIFTYPFRDTERLFLHKFLSYETD